MAPLTVNHSPVENLRQQADLLVQRFKSLQIKCDRLRKERNENVRTVDSISSDEESHIGPIASESKMPSMSECELEKYRLCLRQQSSLLPHLRQQIITLSDSLHPLNLWHNPSSQLDIVLVVQSEIENTLDQVLSASDVICPELTDPSFPINDQYLKELKIYRLFGIFHAYDFVLSRISYVSRSSRALILQLNLSTEQYTGYGSIASTRNSLVYSASDALTRIDSVLKWLSASEFDLVQDDIQSEWAIPHKHQINLHLRDLTGLINAGTLPKEHEEYIRLEKTLEGPLSEPAEAVAKLLVPIFKLCRLFFKRLQSGRGIDRKLLPIFTHMSSEQLYTIGALPGNIDGQLDMLLCGLRNNSPAYQLGDDVKKLKQYFADAGFLILLHFIPIISYIPDFPTQNQFKAWLATWSIQLNLAINNVLNHLQHVRNEEEP